MNDFHNKNVMYVTNVTLRVRDIKKMLEFYTNVLKMKLIYKEGNKYSLGTSGDRVLVSLIVDETAVKVRRTTGLYHFAILLPSRHDLGVFLNYYLANKYPLTGASDHDVSEALYLDDPEGNGIEIYADRPFEKWKFNSDGVFMKTEAIDHISLLKERGLYQEIPVNTLMGHIHLHVNNLAKAEAFFVRILGFNKMLDYGQGASFISDAKYHHHIGYNTWGGTTNPDLGEHNLGLVEYEVNLPQKYQQTLIKSLKDNNIAYKEDGTSLYFLDVNKTSVKMTVTTE